LTAEVVEPGWLTTLPAESRQAVALALAGLYRLGGVDAAREGKNMELEPIPWEQWVESWEGKRATQPE